MADPEMASSEYIGYQVEIFMGFFIPVQIFFVAVRFYSRYITSVKIGVDDILVGVSICLQLIMAGICIGAVRDGCVGYHLEFLAEQRPEKITLLFKYQLAFSSVGFLMTAAPKLAIAALLWRLFPVAWLRWIIYAAAAVIIAACLASIIADFAACHPFEAQWAAPEVQETQCISKTALFTWYSIPNIVTDVVLLVLPMPVVWKLHAMPRMKIALTITFLIGIFGLVACLVRFLIFFSNNAVIDATFVAVKLLIWTEAESGIYLICACLPTYRPVLQRIGLTRLTSSSRPSKNAGYVASGPTDGIEMDRPLQAHLKSPSGTRTSRYASNLVMEEGSDGEQQLIKGSY